MEAPQAPPTKRARTSGGAASSSSDPPAGPGRPGGAAAAGAAAREREDGELVVFDVGGQHFKVFTHLVKARPSTLLAHLLDDLGTDPKQPIFVDASPRRFELILDWYRYGEIFAPADVHVQAVLQDARYFLLPEVVRVNSVEYRIEAMALERASASSAQLLGEEVEAVVLSKWPTFDAYLEETLGKIRAHFQRMAQASDATKDVTAGAPPWEMSISLCRASSWQDGANVCNMIRARVLQARLERRGFSCQLKYHGHGYSMPLLFMVVSLPLTSGSAPQPVSVQNVVTIQDSGRHAFSRVFG